MSAYATPPRLVVAVQPAQAWRVDWRALAATAPGVAWALVTDPESARTLAGASALGLAWVETVAPLTTESLAEVLTRRGAAGPHTRLVTGHESGVLPCARARAACGLAGPDEATALRFRDKREMKRLLAGHAPAYVPRWREHDPVAAARAPDAYCNAVIAHVGLPLFVKPVDGVGSVGSERLESRAAFADWCARPQDRTFEIDEFLNGPVLEANGVIVEGRLVWFSAIELLHPPTAALRGATLAAWTLEPADVDFASLRALTEQVAAALRPPDGAFQVEAVRTAHGLRFLEAAARSAGWLVPDALHARDGFELRTQHLRAAAGLELAPHEPPARPRAAGWFAAVKTRPGRIVRRVDPALTCPHRFEHRPGRGASAVSTELMLADFLCEVVAWHDDAATLRAAVRTLDGFQPYILDVD